MNTTFVFSDTKYIIAIEIFMSLLKILILCNYLRKALNKEKLTVLANVRHNRKIRLDFICIIHSTIFRYLSYYSSYHVKS